MGYTPVAFRPEISFSVEASFYQALFSKAPNASFVIRCLEFLFKLSSMKNRLILNNISQNFHGIAVSLRGRLVRAQLLREVFFQQNGFLTIQRICLKLYLLIFKTSMVSIFKLGFLFQPFMIKHIQ